jgi:NAD(P)-dependent dehydrogenase (short-subunit alcohol dehydrogenase family)
MTGRTDDGSVDRAVRTALDDAGRLDAVVNNAGVMWAGVTEAYPVAYYASTTALEAVAESLRDELAGLGVDVAALVAMPAGTRPLSPGWRRGPSRTPPSGARRDPGSSSRT